jgi:SAM-dependent methyltransferase
MSPEQPVYERIGTTYTATRAADPRIAALIRGALGDAESVVNIGAGTGSYEPEDIPVIAVEPSPAMIAQRPPDAAPVRQGSAESLPLADHEVDAALAVLTAHHWHDLDAALEEIRRVARRRAVIFTIDPDAEPFWLVRHYFPDLQERTRRQVAPLDRFRRLGTTLIVEVPIPRDCGDGFLAAYWARPDAYLDPEVRANISAFHALDGDAMQHGLMRLREDLTSGAWQRRNPTAGVEALECGYRLVIADLRGPSDRRNELQEKGVCVVDAGARRQRSGLPEAGAPRSAAASTLAASRRRRSPSTCSAVSRGAPPMPGLSGQTSS